MIKQILGRLPKKQSKSGDSRDNLSSSIMTGSRNSDSAVYKSGNVKNVLDHGVHPSSNVGLVHGKGEESKITDGLAITSVEALSTFRDVPSTEKHSLVLKKIQLCCATFDFTDPTKNLKEKNIKRQTLLELVDYVSSTNGKFTENVMQEIIKMVSMNLFRLPNDQPPENKVLEGYDMGEEEALMDPAWPHLQIVYEFFLRFVASPETDTKLAKSYMDHVFLIKLLDRFDSEDPRERIFKNNPPSYLWQVHEKFNGIAELLEVLGSIVNGFALPLKEEHKLFLMRVLIPLHKPKCLSMYHQQLSYCITQFVEKDCTLADTVIKSLLKYWTITNSSKEVMFLSQLEEVLEATKPPEFQRCMDPLFRRIARCLSSSHFQVAERTLYLWSNDHLENLIKQNRKVILPIVLPSLEKNRVAHWNQAVQTLTENVRKNFSDADPEFFEECSRKVEEDEAKQQENNAKQEAIWRCLEETGITKGKITELHVTSQNTTVKPLAS